MIEKLYNFTIGDEKKVEKIIDDDAALINHFIFPKGAGLPEHFSNSNVYMIVVSGILSLQLGDQETHSYPAGSIVSIPYNIKMNVGNSDEEVLSMFVIKSPSPRLYKES